MTPFAPFLSRSALLLAALALLLLSPLPGLAAPLAAFSDHTGENHAGEDHRNTYLEGIILHQADVNGSSFRNAVLRNAVLTAADFSGTLLRNADLSGSDLTGSTLDGANARNADFTNAVLDGASFATGEIRNAVFVGASLLGADLSNLSNADRANFTGAFYDAATLLAPGMDTSGMNLVPEPSSALLLLLGLLGLETFGRRLAEAPSQDGIPATA